MKGPMFRILCGPGLAHLEMAAASRAMDRFARYKVRYDVRAIDEETIQNVRMGGQFLDALRSNGPLRLDSTGFLRVVPGKEFRQFIAERLGAIGIGLTDEQAFVIKNGTEQQEVLGTSRFQRGAIVTVSGLRRAFDFNSRTMRYEKDEQTALLAVELAVLHEAGHVLIESHGPGVDSPKEQGHCPYRSCLMQENSGLDDFIERIVKAGLGFCRECTQRIETELGLLAEF